MSGIIFSKYEKEAYRIYEEMVTLEATISGNETVDEALELLCQVRTGNREALHIAEKAMALAYRPDGVGRKGVWVGTSEKLAAQATQSAAWGCDAIATRVADHFFNSPPTGS